MDLLAVTKPASVSPLHCNEIYRANPNGMAVLGPQRVSCTGVLPLGDQVWKNFGEVNKAGERGEMLHRPLLGDCHTSQQAWVTSEQRGFCAMHSRCSLTFLILYAGKSEPFLVGCPWPVTDAHQLLPDSLSSTAQKETPQNNFVVKENTRRSLTSNHHKVPVVGAVKYLPLHTASMGCREISLLQAWSTFFSSFPTVPRAVSHALFPSHLSVRHCFILPQSHFPRVFPAAAVP